jgi:hypothetical protein
MLLCTHLEASAIVAKLSWPKVGMITFRPNSVRKVDFDLIKFARAKFWDS